MRVFTEERSTPTRELRVVCEFTLEELAEALGFIDQNEMMETCYTPLNAITKTWKLKLD